MPQFAVYPHSSYESRTAEQNQFAQPRPCLSEVISDMAPHPWTLSAFRDFLTMKFCLECLEFTVDAAAYRRAFESVEITRRYATPDHEDIIRLKMLWQRILTTYITPSAPYEINISSNARESLISHYDDSPPPPPETLQPALNMMNELMGGAMFVEFLQSRSHLEKRVPIELRKRPSFTIDIRSKSVDTLGYKRANLVHWNTMGERGSDQPPEHKENGVIRVFRNIRWAHRKSSATV